MIEFTYNNTKNANTNYNAIELNCRYHLRVFWKDKINLYLKFYFANQVTNELRISSNIIYKTINNVYIM